MTLPTFRTARRIAGIAAAAIVLAMATPAAAQKNHDAAQATVSSFNKSLLRVMKTAGKLGYKGRYRKLAPAVERAYNLDAMAKGSLGAAWTKLSPEEQAAFRKAFAEFSIATYANRFKNFSGERFAVTGAQDGPRNTVLVMSHIRKSGGEKVKLNYLLRGYDGKWKIVDVFLKGTFSQLATQRAEYGAVVVSEGIQSLISKLNAKTAELGGTD